MERKRVLFLLFFISVTATIYAQGPFADRYRQQLDEQYASGLFKGSNAYMLEPAKDPAAQASVTVFQYLQGRIPGLTINNNKLFAPAVSWRMGRTAFFLNEMQVDASALSMLNINDIGLLKVFRPPFIGAIGNGSGGAIAVYTIKGEEEEE